MTDQSMTEAHLLKQRQLEQTFAGLCFIDPERATREAIDLKPDMISDIKVKAFWTCLLGNAQGASQGADYSALAYQAAIASESLGDLLDWSSTMASSLRIKEFADEIRRRSFLSRQIDPAIARIVGLRQKGDLEGVMAELSSAVNLQAPLEVATSDMTDIALQFNSQVTATTPSTVTTGISPMDRGLGGLTRGDLTILAAPPSMGKTTLALQIAANVARQGQRVLYVSAQMRAVTLFAKLACGSMAIPYRDVLAGRLSDAQKTALMDNGLKIAEALHLLSIDDTPEQDIDVVMRKARQTQPALIVLDMMRDLRIAGSYTSVQEQVRSLIKRSQTIAKTTNAAVLALVHVGRQVGERHRTGTDYNKSVSMNDIADSSAIEKDADTVLMMDSAAYFDPAQAAAKTLDIDLWVEKFRAGPRQMKMNLRLNLDRQLFAGRED